MTTLASIDAVLTGRAGVAVGLTATRVDDGTALAVRDSGAGTDPVTVVLTHGWTLDHTSWDDVTDELASNRAGTRVIAYDHRGHGWSDSGPRGTASLERLADDLADVITQRVPGGRVVLAGHSLGGMAIMALAEQHPDLVRGRVAGVALVATSAGGLGSDLFGLPPWAAARLVRAQTALGRKHLESTRAVNSRRPDAIAPGLRFALFGRGSTRSDRLRAAVQIARSHPATAAEIGASLLVHERMHTLAALGSVPVVVLAGSRDRLCPPPHALRMAEALPAADLVVYPGAGHMLPYERSAEVASQIARLVTPVRGVIDQ